MSLQSTTIGGRVLHRRTAISNEKPSCHYTYLEDIKALSKTTYAQLSLGNVKAMADLLHENQGIKHWLYVYVYGSSGFFQKN